MANTTKTFRLNDRNIDILKSIPHGVLVKETETSKINLMFNLLFNDPAIKNSVRIFTQDEIDALVRGLEDVEMCRSSRVNYNDDYLNFPNICNLHIMLYVEFYNELVDMGIIERSLGKSNVESLEIKIPKLDNIQSLYVVSTLHISPEDLLMSEDTNAGECTIKFVPFTSKIISNIIGVPENYGAAIPELMQPLTLRDKLAPVDILYNGVDSSNIVSNNIVRNTTDSISIGCSKDQARELFNQGLFQDGMCQEIYCDMSIFEECYSIRTIGDELTWVGDIKRVLDIFRENKYAKYIYGNHEDRFLELKTILNSDDGEKQ